MSLFKKVFGQKPKKGPTISEAIKRLKLTENALMTRQTALEEKIKKEIDTARKNASTNKKAALQAVHRKKRFERQLQQIDGALTTLERQLEVLETANTNDLAVASMKTASKALKATHKDFTVDQVDQILDVLADQQELAHDITDAISHPVGFDDDIDEAELERELEDLSSGLEDFSVDKLLPKVPQQNVNDTTVKKKVKEAEGC